MWDIPRLTRMYNNYVTSFKYVTVMVSAILHFTFYNVHIINSWIELQPFYWIRFYIFNTVVRQELLLLSAWNPNRKLSQEGGGKHYDRMLSIWMVKIWRRSTHIHDRSLSLLSTGASINSVRAKLLLNAQSAHLCEIMRSCK